MKYLTIDPGITGTGFAVWDFKWRLIRCGVITPPGKYSWEDKMHYIGHALTEHSYCVKRVYIEYPQVFGGVGGRMVSAKGDLGKLFTTVGFILGYLKCNFELVPVIKWKGQLPKKVVNSRIHEILSTKECALLSANQSHDWDSVGIGLYVKGKF